MTSAGITVQNHDHSLKGFNIRIGLYQHFSSISSSAESAWRQRVDFFFVVAVETGCVFAELTGQLPSHSSDSDPAGKAARLFIVGGRAVPQNMSPPPRQTTRPTTQGVLQYLVGWSRLHGTQEKGRATKKINFACLFLFLAPPPLFDLFFFFCFYFWSGNVQNRLFNMENNTKINYLNFF